MTSATSLKELQDSALEHLWVYLREPSDMAEKGEPTVYVSGEGVRVTDAHGNTSIDAMSGLWLKNIGYGRKEVADAAYEQMLKLTYMPMGTTTEPTIRLAEKVAEITPGDLSRSFFTSGGSESIETAIKLARAYFKRVGEPGRIKFISRKDSYHGATAGAMALGGNHLYPRADYEPLMPGTYHVPQPNFYRCEFDSQTPEECAERCVRAVEDMIKFHGPETVAGVFAEPVSSPMGAVVPPDNYWPLLREVCDKYGVLLIADEVITGFGRTGRMFACEHWGVTPDMMTVAKGITSGYIPMGGCITKKEIADAFVGSQRVSFRHVITFGRPPGGGSGGAAQHPDNGRRRPGRQLRPAGRLPAGRPERAPGQAPDDWHGARPGPDVRHGAGAGPGDQGTLPGGGRLGQPPDIGLPGQRAAPARRRLHERRAAPVRDLRRGGRNHFHHGHGVHRRWPRTRITSSDSSA